MEREESGDETKYITKIGRTAEHGNSPNFRLPIFNFFDRNNKSEPISNRIKVRIILIWWSLGDSNPNQYLFHECGSSKNLDSKGGSLQICKAAFSSSQQKSGLFCGLWLHQIPMRIARNSAQKRYPVLAAEPPYRCFLEYCLGILVLCDAILYQDQPQVRRRHTSECAMEIHVGSVVPIGSSVIKGFMKIQ